MHASRAAFVLGIALLCSCKGADTPTESDSPSTGGEEPLEGDRLTLTGTGVSLIAPPGMRLAPVGAILQDEAMETVITVSTGPTERSLENDPVWRQLFPHEPVQINIDGNPGRLYRRTTEEDAGPYNSWFLVTDHDDRSLSIQAMYQGADESRFGALRRTLESVAWAEGDADPEVAFGVRPGAIDALPLQSPGVGMLIYAENPEPDAAGARMVVLPGPPADPDAFDEMCGQFLVEGFFGGLTDSDPVAIETEHVHGCAAVGAESGSAARTAYMALLQLAEGPTTVTVTASVESAEFDEWLPSFEESVEAIAPTRP